MGYVFIVLFDKIYTRIFDFKNEGDFDSYQLTHDRIFRFSEGGLGYCKDNQKTSNPTLSIRQVETFKR